MTLNTMSLNTMSPEDFLETLTSNSPSYVMVLDSDGLIRFVNRTTRNLSKNEVLGQPIFNFAADQDEIDKLRDCFKQVVTTKKTQLLENKALSPEGALSYWESRVSPIIEANKVTGFILFTNNITTKKAALLEQQAIFNLTEDFLCVLKFDGYFGRVNPAFIEKLGYTEEELLSTPYIDLIHPDDRQMTIDTFTLVTDQHQRVPPFENRYIGKGGNVVSIEWLGTIDLEASRVIGVGRDVTANRELERQLRQAQKMDAIGQLAGGIAHDFNNLLMAISANAEIGLLSDNLDSVKTRLRDIEAATARAAQLTSKLLTFSRNQPLQKKPLDLNHLIQNFLRLLERVLPAHTLLRFEPEVDIPHVAGDKSQLEQVLMNLCVNARDAMLNGGTITITTSLNTISNKTSLVCLDVTDEGGGIADSVKEKIYNPFFTTKSEGKGTGLGLSIVYGIMQKHEGSIDILNSDVSGTTMRLCFPALKQAKAAENTKNQSLPFGGWETVLVAEDEALVAKITKETLEKAGYKVLCASNGLEAVELCANDSTIQLVFMDVIMPQMGGPEAAALIKQTRPEVPILFASGYAPDSHQAMQDDYIVLNKPYRGDELLNTIRTLLDGTTKG
jgi:PAS domain S-box-containing protein